MSSQWSHVTAQSLSWKEKGRCWRWWGPSSGSGTVASFQFRILKDKEITTSEAGPRHVYRIMVLNLEHVVVASDYHKKGVLPRNSIKGPGCG
jgi:hypothetical protein